MGRIRMRRRKNYGALAGITEAVGNLVGTGINTVREVPVRAWESIRHGIQTSQMNTKEANQFLAALKIIEVYGARLPEVQEAAQFIDALVKSQEETDKANNEQIKQLRAQKVDGRTIADCLVEFSRDRQAVDKELDRLEQEFEKSTGTTYSFFCAQASQFKTNEEFLAIAGELYIEYKNELLEDQKEINEELAELEQLASSVGANNGVSGALRGLKDKVVNKFGRSHSAV